MHRIPLKEKENHCNYQANNWYGTSNIWNNFKCKLYVSADFLQMWQNDGFYKKVDSLFFYPQCSRYIH